MKKIILMIVVFALIAVVTTAIFIQQKNNKNNVKVQKSGDNVISIDNSQRINEEKTIDLYSTYNENDLVIETKSFLVDGFDEYFQFPQISGLKDKTIEKKVNKEIEEKISKKMSQYINKEGITDLKFSSSNYQNGNFANVISISSSISYKKDDEEFYDRFGLNYELVNGNELKLKDFFKSDESLVTVVRMALYKRLADMEKVGEVENYTDLHYDSNIGAWLVNHYWYDYENGKEHSEIEEYVPKMTDYEIEKLVKKYFRDNGEDFYFNSYSIYFCFDNMDYYSEAELWLKDIADKVVIYNKYLTKESIFERDDIGAKSILTCSAERELDKYKETKFESDNLFYDIDIRNLVSNDYPALKYVNEKVNDEMEETYKIIDEYKKISNNNPNNFYCLWIEPELESGYNEYRVLDPDLGYYTYPRKNNNLFEIKRKMKLLVCDINKKTEVINAILEKYRYSNISFYGSIYNVIQERSDIAKKQIGVPVTEKIEKHIFDVLSGKEITDVKEIFTKSVELESLVKTLNPYPRQIGKIVKYELGTGGLIAYDDDEYRVYIPFRDIEGYINLKELKAELFPSNTRLLEKSELENLDKDELYRAYNEIFARHGHDFKMQEYKHYFSLFDWYHPIAGKTVSLDELSEIEKENVKLIQSVIDEK